MSCTIPSIISNIVGAEIRNMSLAYQFRCISGILDIQDSSINAIEELYGPLLNRKIYCHILSIRPRCKKA
jgi:hypothetical protein